MGPAPGLGLHPPRAPRSQPRPPPNSPVFFTRPGARPGTAGRKGKNLFQGERQGPGSRAEFSEKNSSPHNRGCGHRKKQTSSLTKPNNPHQSRHGAGRAARDNSPPSQHPENAGLGRPGAIRARGRAQATSAPAPARFAAPPDPGITGGTQGPQRQQRPTPRRTGGPFFRAGAGQPAPPGFSYASPAPWDRGPARFSGRDAPGRINAPVTSGGDPRKAGFKPAQGGTVRRPPGPKAGPDGCSPISRRCRGTSTIATGQHLGSLMVNRFGR